MPFYAMGRMEEHFEKPEEYNPHRWLSDEKGMSKFASLPFGFGARMCIGKRIAELQLKMSLAYVSGCSHLCLQYVPLNSCHLCKHMQLCTKFTDVLFSLLSVDEELQG